MDIHLNNIIQNNILLYPPYIPEYSLEGLMLNLKLQSFSHLMQRTDSFEEILMLGKYLYEQS